MGCEPGSECDVSRHKLTRCCRPAGTPCNDLWDGTDTTTITGCLLCSLHQSAVISEMISAPKRHCGHLCAVIASCLFVFFVAGTQPLQAQSSSSDSASGRVSAADSVDGAHPNTVPYETNRSIAYHVLAAPAYVLHGITRPIGWTILYLERNFPDLFEPKPRRRGVLPLFELGGPVGATVGAALYDNHLFGTNQRGRLEGMIGARDFFEVEAWYELLNPLGAGTRFNLEGNFFSEPQDRFFVGGIESNRHADATRFAREQIDFTGRLQYHPSDRPYGGTLDLLYEHVEARPVEGDEGQELNGRPGLATTDLLTSRVEFALDFTKGQPRTYSGTALTLQLDYTHDLNGDRFRYGRYAAAVHQYVPVFFFEQTRRLALRARVEQVRPIFGGDGVPFYQLPRLGGQRSLRGYVSDRFRDDGALLLTAEYRYPIWSRMDAVFFVDTGQVFNTFDEVAVHNFKTTVGGGFHMLSSRGLSARFEVARSVEGTEIILTVRPAFGRPRR